MTDFLECRATHVSPYWKPSEALFGTLCALLSWPCASLDLLLSPLQECASVHAHPPFYSNYTELFIFSKHVPLSQDFVPWKFSPLFLIFLTHNHSLGVTTLRLTALMSLPLPLRALSGPGTLLCAPKVCVLPSNIMLFKDSCYSPLFPVKPQAPQACALSPLVFAWGHRLKHVTHLY